MKVHEIPRNYRGEGRILYIFTTRSIIFTTVGAGIGWILYTIIKSIFKASTIGLIVMAVFALIGYGIGTLKIPENSSIKVLNKVGGERIDQVVLRYIKFKKKKNKIYVYTKEEN